MVVVVGKWREDAFKIKFRPLRFNRAFLYLNNLTILAPSLADFPASFYSGSDGRVIVATQLWLPKPHAGPGESIMIPSRNTRHEI